MSKWTPEQIERIRELHMAGAMDTEIAREFGVKARVIGALRDYRGIRRTAPVVLAQHPGYAPRAGRGRLYWTDERVAEALLAYARRTEGMLPSGTPAWDAITCGDVTLPPSARVLRQYGAMGNAWRSLLTDAEFRARVRISWVPYTAEENAFIRDNAHRLTATEIATHLRRSTASIRQHALRMGVDLVRSREWYSPKDVAEHYGCPLNRVYNLIWGGELPSRKVGSRIQVEARYLRGIASDYDEREAAEELGAERLERIDALLRQPNRTARRPVALRRHRRPGHNDVITRVPQGRGIVRAVS